MEAGGGLHVGGDLVLEGQNMKPGDYCRAETGSIHSESYTESGCLFSFEGFATR